MADLYKVLGLERGATEEEIRKAYKRRSLETHPDRPGGSKEEFQAVNEANAILSDPTKKADYDATGHIPGAAEDLGGHRTGGIDINQIFSSMFGSHGGMPFFTPDFGGGGARPQKVARGPNMVHDIGVTLAELWAGKTFTLNINRDVLCSGCAGRGGIKCRTCSECAGRGFRVRRQQIGPMTMMSQEPCTMCNQTGEEIGETCLTCVGKCVIKRTAALDVCVKPGMQEGDRLVFPGQCSESPFHDAPGDVILVVRPVAGDAEGWARRGPDLMIEVSLTLAESLLGWERDIPGHPSGKPLHIVWRGGVIREAEVLRIPGWGMPDIAGMPTQGTEAFGDLRVVCRVEGGIQGVWSEEQLRALKSVWPDWKEPVMKGDSVSPMRP
jgi:DnaJ family protein A protein 2